MYVYIYVHANIYIAMYILCITIKLHIGLALMHTRYVAFADHRSAKCLLRCRMQFITCIIKNC